MPKNNCALLCGFLLISTLVVDGCLAQQVYPIKPVRFVVPYPPGGSTDPMARLAAVKLSEIWGYQVVVDNRPGGSTIIGTEAVAKAAADGYTMLLASSALLTTPSLFPRLSYNVLTDFTGVATIGKSRHVLVLPMVSPANSLADLIALARSKPGQLNFATSGVGANTHMNSELLMSIVGIKMNHIPYKGSGILITDLVSGRVDLSFQVPITVLSHIQAGKLKPIAITGETRAPALPEVPTFAESGVQGFSTGGWFGIVMRTATPSLIINKISSDMAVVLANQESKDYLIKQGSEAFTLSSTQVNALIRADIAKFAKIIKDANIKL